jgi:4'-phosphopantetheinyl transferase
MTAAVFEPQNRFVQCTLGPAEVHLRLVDLDDARWDDFSCSLSVEEQARASRYRTAALAQTYRRGRAALRQALAYYAGKPPRSLALQDGQFGKPALRGNEVQFNLSHSSRHALIAVSGEAVGVDLEWIHPGMAFEELAPIVCNGAERDFLRNLPEDARRIAFFQLWTQKEAYCKALGVGLQKRLADIGFDDYVGVGPRAVLDQGIATMTVHQVGAIAGYSASVCAARADAAISWF